MILSAIVSLADAYSLVIFIYVMMSWFLMQPGGTLSDIYDALGKLCEPFLTPFRKLIPPIGGMVDITPIIALLVLQFGVRFIVSLF